MRQLLLLTGVEIKEYLREPAVIFWAILFPILLALGLGVAFSGGSNQSRTIAVVCSSNCQQVPNDSTQQKIGNDKIGFTTYTFVRTTWDEAILMLKQGKTVLVMEQKADSLTYHFDPANEDARFSYTQLSDFFSGKTYEASEVNVLKQSGTRYIDFLVPGLMAMGIMMSCMWGLSYSNVERRSKKLLRRMVATPMKKYNYLISQLLSRLIMSIFETLALLIITMSIFDIKISGSITGLILLFLSGNIFFAGLAWLVASRTTKTQVANGLINLVIMPMMILSGIYFSYHNFPDVMVAIIRVLPLTILADNIRSIFVEGSGLVQVLPAFSILSVTGLVLLFVGIRIYKWY